MFSLMVQFVANYLQYTGKYESTGTQPHTGTSHKETRFVNDQCEKLSLINSSRRVTRSLIKSSGTLA